MAQRPHLSDIQSSPLKLNMGLLSFARGDYRTAVELFLAVITSERQRLGERQFDFEVTTSLSDAPLSATPTAADFDSSVLSGSDDVVSSLMCGLDVEDNVLVEAVNNYAISSMYTCELETAVKTLETLIKEDPTTYLLDAVVFNLCTMYELSCDNILTNRRKRVLREVAERFCLDDVAELSFRITHS